MKENEKGLIHLAKGIDVIMESHIDTGELMIAIGMLVQMLACADKEYGGVKKETFKEMMNKYIDKIFDSEREGMKQ